MDIANVVWSEVTGLCGFWDGSTMDDARNVVSKVKTMIPDADANKFNW